MQNLKPASSFRLFLLRCLALAAALSKLCVALQAGATDLSPVNFNPDQSYAFGTRNLQGVPSVEQTSKDRLWATWYCRQRGSSDDTYVVLSRSDDGGKTWTDPVGVIDEPDKIRAFDPCLWRDPLGRLWWFWSRSVGSFDGVAGTWFIRCDNPNAPTPQWTEPRRIGDGVMVNKPTVMSTGEWVFPIALWGFNKESASNVYVSIDAGVSFARVGGAQYPGRTFDEHMVLERANGEWVLCVRLQAGGIGVCVSRDKGRTWLIQGTLGPVHPDARFFVRKLPSGRWLLIHQMSPTAREGLAATLSEDEGRTWGKDYLIDSRAGVSYPDATLSPAGDIRVVYDYGRNAEKQICLQTIHEGDILKGKPPSVIRSFTLISGANPASASQAASKQETAKPSLAPPAVFSPAVPMLFSPGDKYSPNVRLYQGIPSIAATSAKRIWATWYSGGTGEGPDNYALLAKSDDGGKSWVDPLVVIDGPGDIRAFDPCLWVDPLGRLWWFWAQSHGWYDGRTGTWYSRCDNPNAETLTWSAPVRIADGIMLNKPTVMRDGAWVLPIAEWSTQGYAGEHCASNVYVSMDEGKTFTWTGAARYPGRTYDEHMVVERNDGAWMLFTRLKVGGIGISVSTDKGHTWTNTGCLPVDHPDSRFFIGQLPSGKWLLVHHNSPTGRINLTARISLDQGKTWSGNLPLDPTNKGTYPDAAIGADGRIMVIYDVGRTTDREIRMVSFTEQDLFQSALGLSTKKVHATTISRGTGSLAKSPPASPDKKEKKP